MEEKFYSYHSKHDKIFISILPLSVHIYLGDKNGIKLAAISENRDELQSDIDYVLSHCNSKVTKRWFKKTIGNGDKIHL